MVHPNPTQQANAMPNQQSTRQASTMPNQQPTQRVISNPKLGIDEYGWTAVPPDRSNVPSAETAKPPPASIKFFYPQSDLTRRVMNHMNGAFPRVVLNHNSRIYHYAFAILTTHFPDWIAGGLETPFLETLNLTCWYHDIATTERARATSNMSFEWLGACYAMEQLMTSGAPRAQAQSVSEAILRLTLMSKAGSVTRIGQLMQLAVELDKDKRDARRYLVHDDVIAYVTAKFPRAGFDHCYKHIEATEVREKPWSYTTAFTPQSQPQLAPVEQIQ